MAVVLAVTGAYVYLRMRGELDTTVDQGLRTRAADLAALVRSSPAGASDADASNLIEPDERVAQVLRGDGEVTGGARGRPLLSVAETRRALRGTIALERERVAGIEGPGRLLATPVTTADGTFAVVVGASLDDRDEALASLLLVLAVGGTVALLLASLAGYGVAAAALRPVEAMRGEAEAVSLAEPGRRLPVPVAEDELRRLAETLNEMLARQEVAFARERTFVADASHELRTPLAILRAELELALRRGRSADELETALRSAAEETDRLARLAEDLLVVARSDQGRLDLRVDREPAGELLERVSDLFAGRLAAGRTIEVQAADGLELWCDRVLVEQALGNLVQNAIRHGGGRIVLAADATELRVSDDGPGFPRDFLPVAFERFARADTGRSGGGTGLGLSIVAAIAAAHGGEAGARNRPEGGAEVWIRLPSPPSHPPSVQRSKPVEEEAT